MATSFINYPDRIDGSEIIDNPDKKISGFFTREQVSASNFKAWSQCPARALIEQVLPSEGDALTIGSKTHEVLEKCFSEGLTKEETLALCTAENLDIDSSIVTRVKAYVKAFFELEHYKEDKEAEYLTEQKIITEVSPLGVKLPVPVLGFIDRVDITSDGTYLIDYKTGSRAPYEDMYIDQMIIYKWIYEEFFGQKVKDVYVASLYRGDPKYIRQDITLKKQSQLIDKLFATDEEIKKSLETKEYPKRKGFYCKWCPIAGKCNENCNGDKVEFSSNPFM